MLLAGHGRGLCRGLRPRGQVESLPAVMLGLVPSIYPLGINGRGQILGTSPRMTESNGRRRISIKKARGKIPAGLRSYCNWRQNSVEMQFAFALFVADAGLQADLVQDVEERARG